ncbi:amidohydrolase, partial [Providencia huashanensis]
MSFSKSLLALTVISASFTSFAATPADIIIVDGTVLTMDNKKQVIDHGTVVVKDNKIIAVGGPELAKNYQASDV